MKSAFALVTAVVAASNAFAADLPSRKSVPLPTPPRPLFTGLYAGVQAGYMGFTSLTDAYYAPTNFRYASPKGDGGGRCDSCV